ncbi:MAG: hypothetical protein AAF439_06735 [Pseudomonadota bacterium]
MNGTVTDAAIAGARNLLTGCADIGPGADVVVIAEDPGLGWYDAASPMLIADEARKMGADVRVFAAGPPDQALDDDAGRAVDSADLTVFFARIGDKDRFSADRLAKPSIVSYARTLGQLASDFGRRPHGELTAAKKAADAAAFGADRIEIRCPLGTYLVGSPAAMGGGGDVTVQRFPLCVPSPVLAAGFSGTVALTRCLSPTGSQSYDPPSLNIDGVVMANVVDGRVTGFEGEAAMVDAIRAHHEHVAGLFGIDPWVVHSFHAGIHEGCDGDRPIGDDADLWSNSVFGSPRWLHFHTCGDYAPGEICWMVRDPTVFCDGVAVWDQGALRLNAIA